MSTLRTRISACPSPLRLLLLSELLGLLAAGMSHLSLAWWIASQAGAADLASYGSLTALCSLLAMPLMSPWGDRSPSKCRLVRLGRLCLVLDAAALALLAFSGVYRLWLVCACSALSILAHAVLQPTEASLLPDLVDSDRLPEAMRLRRGAQALGSLLGPGIAGAALAVGGVSLAMAINVLLFSVSAIAAWRLVDPPAVTRRAAKAGWFSDLAAGLRAKWGVPLDRWWTLIGALMMVFLMPATGMLLPLRIRALGLSSLYFGACVAALSIGLLAGVAGLADRLIARLDRLRAVYAAVGVCGLAVGAIGLCDGPLTLVLLFAVMGLCMSVTQLVGQTHRLLAMPEQFRARMTAVSFTLSQLAAALAPALAGSLLLRWPVQQVYGLMAAGFLLSGLLLLAVPQLPHFLKLDHASVKGWYGRHYPHAFEPQLCSQASRLTQRDAK